MATATWLFGRKGATASVCLCVCVCLCAFKVNRNSVFMTQARRGATRRDESGPTKTNQKLSRFTQCIRIRISICISVSVSVAVSVPRFWQPHLMTTPKTVRIRGDFGPNCSHTRSASGPHMPGDAVQLFSHQINALKRATLIAQLQTGTIVSPGTPQGGTSISRAMTRSETRSQTGVLDWRTAGLPDCWTAASSNWFRSPSARWDEDEILSRWTATGY